MGDSIVLGMYGKTGGWRVHLTGLLSSAGVSHEFVGPYTNVGKHRGVNGTSAYQQTSQVQTDCETYDPHIIIIAYGVNDIGGVPDGGQGRTAAQTEPEIEEVIAWARAGAPHAHILVQTVIVPQGSTYASYWSRRAEHIALNAALPALCAANGVTMVDVGAPATTDDIHPSDGAGYPAMADTYLDAILSVIP